MLDFPLELLEDEFFDEEETYVEEVHGEYDQECINKYGPLKVGKWYYVTDEQNDWVAVRLHGKRILTPNWVFKK